MTKLCALLLPLFILGAAPALAAPAPTPSAEAPAALDPVDVNAEKRLELAFRTMQLGLERGRSDRIEDADRVACIKQTPVGTHVPVINCATNRQWSRIRAASLANGLAGFENTSGVAGSDSMKMATGSFVQSSGMDGVGVPSASGPVKREDAKVVTISMNDYNKLKKRFGELPPDIKELASADGR